MIKTLKYFHIKASQRRKKNKLLKIKDSLGNWQYGVQRDNNILSYFEALYSTSDLRGSTDFLASLSGRVTSSINESFSHSYTKAKVDVALSQMHPSKLLVLMGCQKISTRSIGLLLVLQ